MFSANVYAASRNNVWCASSTNTTNFANVNSNGNPNNTNASGATVAAPGFYQRWFVAIPAYWSDQVSVSLKGVPDRKEKTTERTKTLNLHSDTNVRTLLAWSVIVSSADFMHGGYADRKTRYINLYAVPTQATLKGT